MDREYTYDWKPENYDKPNEPILKISKSSLGSFDWCPEKYKNQYPLRMPIDQTPAMYKGTVVHNTREDFFNTFDVKKAESMTPAEVEEYILQLHPIDDFADIYINMASFEAERFIEARQEGKVDEFLPVINEKKFDCVITIKKDQNKKYPLKRDYDVHLQGIIDRVFMESGGLIPFEFKTGPWKDYKMTMMRKEMAFYQIMINNTSDEIKEEIGCPPGDVTHWGWYYPVSNYVYVEEMKKSTVTAVLKNIAKLIFHYEWNMWPPKYNTRTCGHCSFFGICSAVQEETWV